MTEHLFFEHSCLIIYRFISNCSFHIYLPISLSIHPPIHPWYNNFHLFKLYNTFLPFSPFPPKKHLCFVSSHPPFLYWTLHLPVTFPTRTLLQDSSCCRAGMSHPPPTCLHRIPWDEGIAEEKGGSLMNKWLRLTVSGGLLL